MKKKVTIIDYGLGNILSAQQSFMKVARDNKIDASILITNEPKDISESTHIVLPGQGAFMTCMNNLFEIPGMIEELTIKVIQKKTPFLGICIGMQLLANVSYENGVHKGLGWIEGKIKKIPSKNLKLPHMSWNDVQIVKQNKLIKNNNIQDYYFVHSYYFHCDNKENVIGVTNYEINFTSFVCKENIYGVQFHPEKSSAQGLSLIKNFLLI